MEPWLYYADIIRWIDGDTVEFVLHIFGNHRMGTPEEPLTGRLIGIDTPERREPLFEEATEYANSLAPEGQRTLLRTVRVKNKLKDSFGRYFVIVYTPDYHNINESLLASGFAVPYVD